MPDNTATTPETPIIVVERKARAPKQRRHRLEEDPPPPMRCCTVKQIEAGHPGLHGKLPDWIKKADAGDSEFRWLKLCIVRVGRSVYIDDIKFRDQLYQRTAMPPAPSRRDAKVTA